MAKYIDVTPKWADVLKVLVYCAMDRDSSPKAKTAAWAELRRMASIADMHVAKQNDSGNVLAASLLNAQITKEK